MVGRPDLERLPTDLERSSASNLMTAIHWSENPLFSFLYAWKESPTLYQGLHIVQWKGKWHNLSKVWSCSVLTYRDACSTLGLHGCQALQGTNLEDDSNSHTSPGGIENHHSHPIMSRNCFVIMLKLHPLILCVKKSIPPTAHGIRRQNLNSNWNHGFFGPNF